MTDKNKERLEKAKESLENYKVRINDFIEKYLAEKLQSFMSIEPEIGGELGELGKEFILRGGKRMRAAFTYYGYRAVGDKDEDNILFASAGMEILHSFFLIHDDIIDVSDIRHNMPTVHKIYQRKYEQMGLLQNFNADAKEHFGASAAIMAGDICCALAYEAMIESGFQAEKILKALKMMQETVRFTAVGEMLDIVKPLSKKAVTEYEVQQIQYLKTAKYTIESPLHLGAILQGTTDDVLKSLSEYGIPVGIAFQISDDILGIFADEKTLGKPVGSDIKEGKRTLLTIKALDNASTAERDKINSLLGNSSINQSDVKEFRKIIENTGAYQYSIDHAAALVEKGKEAITRTPIRENIKEILLGMADYVIERDY
ncbi:polyprenyl synthetase family protein [Chloroflexota bacterium]